MSGYYADEVRECENKIKKIRYQKVYDRTLAHIDEDHSQIASTKTKIIQLN